MNSETKKMKKRGHRNKFGTIVPAIILIAFVLIAIFADLIAPHSPGGIKLEMAKTPPFWQSGGNMDYPLGTDDLGRDILSRLIFGARVSLIVAFIGVIGSGVIGTVLGILAGYFGGRIDDIISRIVDVMMSFPTILLALVLAVVLDASLFNVGLILILTYWARYTRLVRGETLKAREMGYVTFARTSGCSDSTIMTRHIFPNVINSLIVMATFNVGAVITLEASLSFLGVGVPPPEPSWGSMCADGRALVTTAWWISFMPGLAVTMVVLSSNLFGDWIRDKLDPQLQAIG